MSFKTCIAATTIFTALATASAATPFRMDYSVTALGTDYQYDFVLTLDNNDGSWVSGQEFDWFVIGEVALSQPSLFPEGANFFTDVPAGWITAGTGGGHNGPTLGFGSSVALEGYAPTSVGQTLEFQGVSSVLADENLITWSNLVVSPGAVRADFVGMNLVDADVSAVPLPAGLPLLAGGLALFGFIRRRA